MPDQTTVEMPTGMKKIRGVSGTLISLGEILNGDRQDMSRDEFLEFARTMLKNPIIKSARDARMQTLLSASWRIKSAKEGNAEADKYRDFAAENFGLNGHSGLMDQSFESLVKTAMLYEDVGFRYGEAIWRRPTSSDGWIRLGRIADRLPSAHSKWIRKNGTLTAVQQKAFLSDSDGFSITGVGAYYDGPVIPSSKLLLLTREREGDNYEGVGTLMACLFEAKLTHHAMSTLGMALERWGFGTPMVSWSYQDIMEDIAGMGLKAQDVIDMVTSTMKKYMAQEESVLLKPKGFEIDVFGDAQLKLDGFKDIEDMITRRIQYAYLVQFMSLGQGSTGARSVGETQLDFLYEGAANSLDYFAGTFGGRPRPGAGIIGRLIEYNFGPVDPSLLPRLEHRGLRTSPLMQAIGQLGTLRQNNLIQDTDDLEAQLLDELSASPSEEGLEQSRSLRKARQDYIKEADPLASAGPTTEPQKG